MVKSLNAVLGTNLRVLTKLRGLSFNALGKKAGVAPNTIANYCRAADESPDRSSSGKERSAKLAEIELIAAALGVPPLALLTDSEALARQADSIRAAAAEVLGAQLDPRTRMTEVMANARTAAPERVRMVRSKKPAPRKRGAG